MVAFLKAFTKAKRTKSGKPQLIMAKTIIGKGIAEVQGPSKGHGEGGAKFSEPARASLGLPADQHFFVGDDVRAYFEGHKQRLVRAPATNGTRPTEKRGPPRIPRRPRC